MNEENDGLDWERTYTLAEYLLLELPAKHKLIELVDGKLLKRPARGENYIVTEIGSELTYYATKFEFESILNRQPEKSPGSTYSFGRVLVKGNPQIATVRVPNACYVSKERMAELEAQEPALVKLLSDWFIMAAPDWVLEFMRPTDNRAEVQARVEDFRQAGVRLLWLVEYDKKLVHVFHENNPEVQTLGVGDILDGAGVLPDVHIKLAEIFRYN